MVSAKVVANCLVLVSFLWLSEQEDSIKVCANENTKSKANQVACDTSSLIKKDINIYNVLSEHFVQRKAFETLEEEFRKNTVRQCDRTTEVVKTILSAVQEIKSEVKNLTVKLIDFIQKSERNADAFEDFRQLSFIIRAFETSNEADRDPNIKLLAGKTRKLKETFIKGDFKGARTREECFQFCFYGHDNSNNEVCQISYGSYSSFRFKCRISSARAKYVRAFPSRYVEVNTENPNIIYEIYLNSVRDDLPSTTPILYYALDSVSRHTNLGSLGADKYSLDMGPTTPRYECNATFSKHKFLRLLPSDNFLIQIPNVPSIPFNNPRHFTIITWMRKLDPKQQAPLLEATSSSQTIIDWWLWNHDAPDKISAYFGRQVHTISAGLSIPDWNIVAYRITDNNLDLFINSVKVGTVTATTKIRTLGDNIYIGKRVGNPNGWGWVNHMFDGCMANLMIFPTALSDADIIQYGKLQLDPDF